MKVKNLVFTLIFCNLILFKGAFAQENDSCSRVARINFQDVLVDTCSSRKGEGLKFYLEKDPIAKTYYNKYVDNQKNQLIHSVLGTAGIGLIMTGVLKSNDPSKDNFKHKGVWIAGGALMLTINALLAITISNNNEKNIQRAIQEYNKRNLPKIYFGPYFDKFGNNNGSKNSNLGITGGFQKDF